MMRLAILSDIHGNIVALDAVLEDIQAQGGVDEYWILGDLVDAGPAPVAVLERLSAVENITFIRGNTDRYVVATDARDALEALVATNDKRRFSFDDEKRRIRASQGHSVEVDLRLDPIEASSANVSGY